MASLATAMVSTLENVNYNGTQNTGFTAVDQRRRRCTDANHPPNNTSIIVNKISLRWGKASILRKIAAMKAHIGKMCDKKRHVQCIDACPKALDYFRET